VSEGRKQEFGVVLPLYLGVRRPACRLPIM